MPGNSEMPVLVCDAALVYDVGGSHVSAAVCLDSSYRLGAVVRAPYPATQSGDAFADFLHVLGLEASTGLGTVSGAELGMPGPFDFSAGVSLMRHKLPYLYGVSLREHLAQRFGWQGGQVRFLHDSAAFLLGEIGAGAAFHARRAVGITLGTGIGSAFAVDGRVVTEGEGVPPGGEIWNLSYEGGIVEDFVSARGIQRNYKQRTGMTAEVDAIASAAPANSDSVAAFAAFGRHLGRALRMTLSAFAPDAVVIGGGIARSSFLFLPVAQSQLDELSFRLQISALKDNAPLVGAAVAWFNGPDGAMDPSAQAAADAAHADAL